MMYPTAESNITVQGIPQVTNSPIISFLIQAYILLNLQESEIFQYFVNYSKVTINIANNHTCSTNHFVYLVFHITSKMFARMTILSQTLQNAYSIYVPLLMWLQLFVILNEQGLSRNHIMLQTFEFDRGNNVPIV